jgi:hypothetical protein
VAAVLTCEQVQELEAAFALGTLDGAEASAVLDHLESCDKHPGIPDLRAAVLALAFGAEEREPPAALRARVLTLAAPDGARGNRHAAWPVRRMVLGLAASVVVLLGAILAAVVISSSRDEADHYARSFTTEDGIEVRVEADFSRPVATVTFAHMQTLPEGEKYVVWAIRDGVWLSMGRFRPNESGWWSGEFAFQLREGDSLCVTQGEPIDPSIPHGQPLFIEPL